MRLLLLVALTGSALMISAWLGSSGDRVPAGAVAARPRATPVVDQASCPVSASSARTGVAGSTWKAQTFVAGMSGELVQVELPGRTSGPTTTLHIRATNACDGILPTDLATTTAARGTTFTFEEGPRLEAGRLYALVLSRGGDGIYEWAYSDSPTCYPVSSGHPFTSLDAGRIWSRDNVDFHFTTMMAPDPAATPTATPVIGPTVTPSSPGDAITKRHVMVISLPTGQSDAAHVDRMSRHLIELLKRATRYHGYAAPSNPPYMEYEIYQDEVFVEPVMPPRCGDGNYNLDVLFTKHDICALAQQGAVDEVWFWDGGQGGLPEWGVSGPEWSAGYAHMPDCGRQMVLMVFNNTREYGVALESYAHRLEATFMAYFPCDFSTASWPWPNSVLACAGEVSDRTGFVGRPFVGNGDVGVCGDAHHPPNIRVQQDYIFNSPDVVDSICPDWQRDDTARVSRVSCADWGCTEEGYQVWWMQNLPGYQNTNRDRLGTPQPNWWSYLFGRPTPITPMAPTGTPEPTSTVTPTAPRPTVPPTAPPPTVTAEPRWRIVLPWAER
jgi:hypothetical protein